MVSRYEQLQTALSATITVNTHSYPARFHKDVELLHVLEGTMDMMVDGENWHLQAGDICVLFPNILHSITGQHSRKHLIMISPALLIDHSELLSRYKPVSPVVRANTVPSIVPALLQRCVELHRDGNPALIPSHITSVLGELLGTMQLQPRSSEPELVQQLVERVLADYTEELTLECLAQQLGYSKFHLSRVVADTFGCNFRTLLNSYRISAAEELLRSSRKTVIEIAYATGFQNQSSFNRVFLKLTGMTPTQYRITTC